MTYLVRVFDHRAMHRSEVYTLDLVEAESAEDAMRKAEKRHYNPATAKMAVEAPGLRLGTPWRQWPKWIEAHLPEDVRSQLLHQVEV